MFSYQDRKNSSFPQEGYHSDPNAPWQGHPMQHGTYSMANVSPSATTSSHNPMDPNSSSLAVGHINYQQHWNPAMEGAATFLDSDQDCFNQPGGCTDPTNLTNATSTTNPIDPPYPQLEAEEPEGAVGPSFVQDDQYPYSQSSGSLESTYPSSSSSSTYPKLESHQKNKAYLWDVQIDPKLEKKRKGALRAFKNRQKQYETETYLRDQLQERQAEVINLHNEKARMLEIVATLENMDNSAMRGVRIMPHNPHFSNGESSHYKASYPPMSSQDPYQDMYPPLDLQHPQQNMYPRMDHQQDMYHQD